MKIHLKRKSNLLILLITFLISPYSFSSDLWPNGIVKYRFEEDVPKITRRDFKRATRRWGESEYISFEEVPKSYLKPHSIIFYGSDGGCISFIGYDENDSPPMWLSDRCYYSIILHEIGHLLGLRHEHQRSDRDKHIVFNTDFLIKHTYSENNIFSTHDQLIGPYDQYSIMHYGEYVVPGMDDQYEVQTIHFKDKEKLFIPETQRDLTKSDFKKIEILYRINNVQRLHNK